MSEQLSDVTFHTTYTEPSPVGSPPSSEADMCIQIIWVRADGLDEWHTHLTVEEAVDLRAKLYVAICATGASA